MEGRQEDVRFFLDLLLHIGIEQGDTLETNELLDPLEGTRSDAHAQVHDLLLRDDLRFQKGNIELR